ncbi:MAG: SIR2 family protein [bacterium]|nr:SIR2 family protein [bacterium]
MISKVKDGKCILFLGSMAHAPSPERSRYEYKNGPPSGAALSKRLAKACQYPYKDSSNLQRVSLYMERRKGGSRKELVDALRAELDNGYLPSPALEMLAALPFPVIITTNYDNLFDLALGRANTTKERPKRPLPVVYDPDNEPEDVPLDPEEEKPILFKLHGELAKPKSLVVTEVDYFKFIERMSLPDRHPIPLNIRARLNTWPVLFIGYSLKDYNLRLLFNSLRWNLKSSQFPVSFSVDPSPDNLIVTILEHDPKRMVSFLRQNLWDFVPALYEACTR